MPIWNMSIHENYFDSALPKTRQNKPKGHLARCLVTLIHKTTLLAMQSILEKLMRTHDTFKKDNKKDHKLTTKCKLIHNE